MAQGTKQEPSATLPESDAYTAQNLVSCKGVTMLMMRALLPPPPLLRVENAAEVRDVCFAMCVGGGMVLLRCVGTEVETSHNPVMKLKRDYS